MSVEQLLEPDSELAEQDLRVKSAIGNTVFEALTKSSDDIEIDSSMEDLAYMSGATVTRLPNGSTPVDDSNP